MPVGFPVVADCVELPARFVAPPSFVFSFWYTVVVVNVLVRELESLVMDTDCWVVTSGVVVCLFIEGNIDVGVVFELNIPTCVAILFVLEALLAVSKLVLFLGEWCEFVVEGYVTVLVEVLAVSWSGRLETVVVVGKVCGRILDEKCIEKYSLDGFVDDMLFSVIIGDETIWVVDSLEDDVDMMPPADWFVVDGFGFKSEGIVEAAVINDLVFVLYDIL